MSKKKIIAFDLETIANPFIMDILPEVTAKGNLKDPEKIAIDIQEKKRKQIADMGLDPMMNMICCAGFYSEDGPGSISIEDATNEAEKKLLIDFWEVLAGYDVFVGFNSRAFDIRCMLLHGIAHGIRPGIAIDHGKYNRGNHIDLRPILAGEGMFAKGKLDFFCKLFLGDQKTEGMTGDQVQSYFDLGLHDDISEYCMQDSSLTYRLYKKVEVAGLLE
jgi:predicted PolB exonuclease-like 3'-5' exonuclease